MKAFFAAALFAACSSLAACVPYDTHTSSTALLTTQQSRVVIAGDTARSAHIVTKALASRGFFAAPGTAAAGPNATVLTFSGTRSVRRDGSVVASVFTATLRPRADGTTELDLAGKPTVDGGDAYVYAPVAVSDSDVSGQEEAAVVQSVLAELGDSGKAVPTTNTAVESPAQEQAQLDSCLAQRKAILDRAEQVQNLETRGKLLQSAPECPTS